MKKIFTSFFIFILIFSCARPSKNENANIAIDSLSGSTTTQEQLDAYTAASLKKEQEIVTLTEYNLLKTGFSYDSVCKIIGSPGQELSSSEIGGYKTVMYMWSNPDGGNMNVMFQNDRMISKAQLGLR